MPGDSDPTPDRTWFESPLGLRVWADERGALTRMMGDLRASRVVDARAGDGPFAAEISSEGTKWLQWIDSWVDRPSIGAAFIAVAGRKPATTSTAAATGAQSRRTRRARYGILGQLGGRGF